MATRKAKLGKKIEADILKVLQSSSKPISTRDIALKIGRAWHSVQGHCFRLQISGKINGYRISNLNVWEIKKIQTERSGFSISQTPRRRFEIKK